jgi:hypothetical protein
MAMSIYNQFFQFLILLINGNRWVEIQLNIEIQPGMIGMNGFYLDVNSKRHSFRTKASDKLRESINQFHKETTSKDYESRWNKFIFKMNTEGITETVFLWDAEWQSEVDNLNAQIKINNPNYVLLKWHWDL